MFGILKKKKKIKRKYTRSTDQFDFKEIIKNVLHLAYN